MPPTVKNITRQSPQSKRQPSAEKQEPAGNSEHNSNNQQRPSGFAQRFHTAPIVSDSPTERELATRRTQVEVFHMPCGFPQIVCS
jgi:hypothetical protein